jgi:hypothetical protein
MIRWQSGSPADCRNERARTTMRAGHPMLAFTFSAALELRKRSKYVRDFNGLREIASRAHAEGKGACAMMGDSLSELESVLPKGDGAFLEHLSKLDRRTLLYRP